MKKIGVHYTEVLGGVEEVVDVELVVEGVGLDLTSSEEMDASSRSFFLCM